MNISKTEKAFSSLIKAKLKTFLLNQNTFYFNSRVNSDSKILSLLPRIVESAFHKLDLYLNKIFGTKSFVKKITPKVKNNGRSCITWPKRSFFVFWTQAD